MSGYRKDFQFYRTLRVNDVSAPVADGLGKHFQSFCSNLLVQQHYIYFVNCGAGQDEAGKDAN